MDRGQDCGYSGCPLACTVLPEPSRITIELRLAELTCRVEGSPDDLWTEQCLLDVMFGCEVALTQQRDHKWPVRLSELARLFFEVVENRGRLVDCAASSGAGHNCGKARVSAVRRCTWPGTHEEMRASNLEVVKAGLRAVEILALRLPVQSRHPLLDRIDNELSGRHLGAHRDSIQAHGKVGVVGPVHGLDHQLLTLASRDDMVGRRDKGRLQVKGQVSFPQQKVGMGTQAREHGIAVDGKPDAKVKFMQIQLPKRTVEVGLVLRGKPRSEFLSVIGRPTLEPLPEERTRRRKLRTTDSVQKRIHRFVGPHVCVVVADPSVKQRKVRHAAQD